MFGNIIAATMAHTVYAGIVVSINDFSYGLLRKITT